MQNKGVIEDAATINMMRYSIPVPQFPVCLRNSSNNYVTLDLDAKYH